MTSPQTSAPDGAPAATPRLAGGLRTQAVLAITLKAGAAGSALLLQWLIARMYGPEGTGLFALMATTVTFIAVLAVAGQDYIALRNVAGDLAEGDEAGAGAHADASVRIAGLSTIAGTAVVAATAFYYGAGVQPAMLPILLLAAPVVAGLALGRVFAFTARAGGRVLSSQLPDGPITSTAALVLLGGAALAWRPEAPPSWTLGLVYGLAYAAALLYAFLLYRQVRAGWKPAAQAKPLRPLLMAGFPLVVGSSALYFSDWLIIFTATSLFSPELAGQIRICTLYLSVIYLVTIAFDSVLAPSMAAAIRLGERARLRRLYRNYALGSLVFALPLIAAALFAPERVLALFGPEFVPAAPALRLGAAVQSLTVALGPAGTILVMAHRERQVLIVNAVGVVVLVLGCWLAIPAFGLIGGVATATLTLLSRRVTEVLLIALGPGRIV